MSRFQSLTKQRGSLNAERWKSEVKNRCLKSLHNKRKNRMQKLREGNQEPEILIGEIIKQEIEQIYREEQENFSNAELSEQERCEFLESLEEYLHEEYTKQLMQMGDDYEESIGINDNNDVACNYTTKQLY